MPDRILIVEDEDNIRHVLGRILMAEGYEVSSVDNIYDAIQQVRAGCFDLILLDLAVGRDDGLRVVEVARDRCPFTAVVVLTGHGSMESAIESIELGVQAYLLKPVSPDELVNRVRTAISEMAERARMEKLASHVHTLLDLMQKEDTPPKVRPLTQITDGDFCMNLQQRKFTIKNREIDLTQAEFDILRVLMQNKGRVISAEHLIYEGLGYNLPEAEAARLIRSHISRIRHKLIIEPAYEDCLLTIRGRGYTWSGSVNT